MRCVAHRNEASRVVGRLVDGHPRGRSATIGTELMLGR
jgi:hypothetical protein